MAAMNQVLSTRTVLTAAPFTVLFAVCVIGALMADPDRRGLVALCAIGAGVANFVAMFLIGREILGNARPDAPAAANTQLAALAAGGGAVVIAALMLLLV